MGLVFQDSYGLDGTFASLTANEQAALRIDVQQAENDLSTEFTNSVTAKVDVEAINVPLVDGSGFIASNAASAYRAVTLSTYFAALQSVATTAYQTNAVAAIKNLTDDTGSNYVLLPSAYANMLGLGSAGTYVTDPSAQFTTGGPTYNLSSSVDDTVFLNLAVVQTALDAQAANTPNDSIVAVIEHELTENVMGRISSLLSTSVGGSIGAVWEPADFFRVNSAGQSDLTPNTTTPIFFSPDPGVTGPVSSLQFNNSSGAGDFADWTTTSTSDPAYTDPLGAGGFNGAVGTETSQLSPTDIDLMNVLGWTIATGGGSTASLTLGLKTDTGASSSDKLTSVATLTGVATPNATVTLSENGATLGTATADAGGAWTFTPTLADGAHNIVASEPAGAGQPLTASLAFTLASQAPTVNASESVSGSTSLTSDTITISAVAENVGANAISGVEIFDGNADLGSALSSGGSWTFTVQNLLAGTHVFTVKATDLAGNTTSTALAAVNVTTSAPPAGYVLSAFTFTGTGVTDIRPKGVNDSGEVVGYYIDARADAVGADGLTYDEHGFVSTVNSGVRQYFTIDNPISPTGLPLVQTRAFAVNDNGDVVGWYSQQGYGTADNGSTYALPTAGFINSANWPGTFGTLSYSAVGDYGTHTLGINASDEIVGFYYDGSGEQHGFLRNFTGYGVRGGYVSFDPANSINTVAEGINDSGEIVGFYEAVDKTVHGFTYNSLTGVFATIDVNGAASTEALGVNDSGDVVGTYFDNAGIRHGFVRGPNGQVTTIDDPNAGSGGTLVGGINNKGEIVGWYTGTDGHDHGFTGLPAAPTLVISTATGPSTVTLSGSIDAADNDATIGIYDGAALLATTTANASGAWSANVSVASVGAHILTAQATNAGGAGISNAVVDLVGASDSLNGGGQVVLFSGSGDAVTLSNSAGAWDHVSGSNGVISLNAAQVGVSGGGDTIDFLGGAASVVSLSWTGAGTYIINGFTSGDTIDISGFTAGDAIDLVGLTSDYSPTITNGAEPSSATLTVAGNVVTQSNADGSKLSSHFNVTGQSYTTIVRSFDAAGDLTAVEHEGLTGTPYTADTTLYSGPGTTGNIVSGNDLFYVNQASGLSEVDLDGSQNLTRALYAYTTTAPGARTGFEADYVAGEFAGGVANYLAPAGSNLATFAVEYDDAFQYYGIVYTFTYTGQAYDQVQYTYSAGSQSVLVEATFSQYTGSGGPNVASFFYDDTGAFTGSQYSYTGITGQAYTSDTLLYNASNVLIAAEYGGYTTKPFSSQTTFYNASGVAQEITRDFTGPTAAGSINGQAYNAYEKILNPAFGLLATAYHLDNGANVYVGVASGVSSPTFGGTGVSANAAELSNTLTGGDWTITGGGTGETFNFASFFNKAEITDYGTALGSATDVVSVSTQDFANWQTMLGDAAASGGGADTTFTSTTTGDKLTLDGVTLAQLQNLTTNQASADFLFHA